LNKFRYTIIIGFKIDFLKIISVPFAEPPFPELLPERGSTLVSTVKNIGERIGPKCQNQASVRRNECADKAFIGSFMKSFKSPSGWDDPACSAGSEMAFQFMDHGHGSPLKLVHRHCAHDEVGLIPESVCIEVLSLSNSLTGIELTPARGLG
jgi:hypothetical protein